MKAFKATVQSSQPVLSDVEFQTIFYKIPELHILHSNFLENLKRHSTKWDTKIGDCFKNMVMIYFVDKCFRLLHFRNILCLNVKIL